MKLCYNLIVDWSGVKESGYITAVSFIKLMVQLDNLESCEISWLLCALLTVYFSYAWDVNGWFLKLVLDLDGNSNGMLDFIVQIVEWPWVIMVSWCCYFVLALFQF